jgi:hypothetical protein
MSRTWQTCSMAVKASLGTPSQDAGFQCTDAAEKCVMFLEPPETRQRFEVDSMEAIVPAGAAAGDTPSAESLEQCCVRMPSGAGPFRDASG